MRGLGLAMVAVLISTFTPLPNLLAHGMEMRPRSESAQAIVVLGNGITSDGFLEDTSMRGTLHGITLFREHRAPLLLFSGSRTPRAREADVRAQFAREMGVPAERIEVEGDATTTRDEATRIARRLLPRGITTILLVSAPLHLPRAVPLFERAGFQVLPSPSYSAADTFLSPSGRLDLIITMTRELVARIYGRLGDRLPAARA